MRDIDLTDMTVTEMYNLSRRDDGNYRVEAPGTDIGPARRTVGMAGCGRDLLVTESARMIEAARVTADGPEAFESVGMLGCELLCATVHGDRVDMLTETGLWRMTVSDGRAEAAGHMPRLPVCRLESRAAGEVTVTVDADRVETVDDAFAPLSRKDARRLAAAHAAGYERLAAAARADGCVFEPVAARCRITDADGNTVMLTPPVILGAEQDYYDTQRPLTGNTVAGYTMTGRKYRVTLKIDGGLPEAWQDMGARAEVLVSPALHGLDPRAAGTARRHATGTSSAGMAVTVTSAGSAFDRRNAARADESARRVACATGVMRVAAIVERPFGEGARSIDLDIAPAGSAAEELTMLDKTLNAPADPRAPMMSSLGYPHRHTARHAATAGRLTLRGDIEVSRGCPALTELATETTDEPWRGWVEVTMADGSNAVWHGEGESGAPARLSSVLSYPGGDAVRMSVGLSRGGRLMRSTYSLRPSADGTCSQYAAARLEPMEPAQAVGVYVVPAERPLKKRYPTMVAAIPSGGCGAPLLAGDTGAEVRCLAAAPAGAAGWEFGREHFLAGTAGGLVKVSVNAAVSEMSFRTIDSRAVTAMAARTDDVAVLAGGSLVEAGRTTATTRAAAPGASSVAYDRLRDEVWTADGSGTATVYPRKGLPRLYDLHDITAVSGAGGEVYGTTRSGRMVALSHPANDTAACPIRLKGHVTPGRGARTGVRRVTVPRLGSHIDVDVRLNGESEIHLAGMTDGPVVIAARVSPCRTLEVEIEGTVRAGS